jgi:hypothetical protein
MLRFGGAPRGSPYDALAPAPPSDSADPLGRKTRTRYPSAASYSRTVVTASDTPNGCSLDTTMFPLGAMAKSIVAV